MKVEEIMTRNPKACTPTDCLADAARFMWDSDCGVLPVVAHGGDVVGLITDRDICMAAAINNRNLSNMAVEEVVSGKVYSVKATDDVHRAFETMREHRVRRLPVLNDSGQLAGMLSMNDLVGAARETEDKKRPAIGYAEIVDTYKAICKPRQSFQAAAASV